MPGKDDQKPRNPSSLRPGASIGTLEGPLNPLPPCTGESISVPGGPLDSPSTRPGTLINESKRPLNRPPLSYRASSIEPGRPWDIQQ